MPEKTIDIKYVGDYPGTIGTKSYVPGEIYQVSEDLADQLMQTGQFVKMEGEVK